MSAQPAPEGSLIRGPETLPNAAGPSTSVKRGARRWFHSYLSMLRWHLVSLRIWLPTLIAVQVLSGVGFVLGIALLFDHTPASAALFVATGVPTVNLVVLGVMLGPQLVVHQKIEGSYEYMTALPVPKSANALAWYTVTLVGGLPPIPAALTVAWLRYDLPIRVSGMIVPAVIVTSFTGAMLGYALAHAVSSPMVARLTTQLLVFVIFGFCPILFPISQLPRWLAALNWWFPFRHMAVIVRASLTDGPHPGLLAAYPVVGAWALASAALAGRALSRRP